MSDAIEIHRGSEVTRLREILEKPSERLTICGISGPGGIGKSFLLSHVLEVVDPQASHYLKLTVDGSNRQARGDFFGLLDSQLFPRSLPPPASPGLDYFPQMRKVAAIHRRLVEDVTREMARAPAELKDAAVALLKAGHMLNKVVRKSRQYLDVSALNLDHNAVRDSLDVAWDAVSRLKALHESNVIPGPLRDAMGITLRSRVRRDLHQVTADAMLTDLSAAVSGYRPRDFFKITQEPIPGLGRVLLVIDDFEAIGPLLEDFIVGALIPKLAGARFQTVLIVLGRDDLEAMHPGWAQHCKRFIRDQIRLAPFGRESAFALLADAGVPTERHEEYFKNTQGFPFLLNLLVEERLEDGAESALFLRKFYDRITRWMSSSEEEWFVKVCYLDAVNVDTLKLLFPESDVAKIQDWFEREASIRDPAARVFRVRPLVREKVLRYQEVRAPSRHRELLSLASVS